MTEKQALYEQCKSELNNANYQMGIYKNEMTEKQALYEQCKSELNNANYQMGIYKNEMTEKQSLYEQCKAKLEETNRQLEMSKEESTQRQALRTMYNQTERGKKSNGYNFKAMYNTVSKSRYISVFLNGIHLPRMYPVLLNTIWRN
ncbi:hypothetical protein CEXT_52171 [Caerostris extrusa]|uniref:Uncharacterized protein n=1 Tax=Caerostris extrusa TaxID=172846 RepID=A0AAV4YDM2_CAEEX|nr:hypothetical protein CEXT_52171 [Caerostris extrusa]